MAKTNNEVLRGRVNKAGNIEVEIDTSTIDWRNPISISAKGNASFKFKEKYLVEVVDKDGITLPLTVSVGVYVTKDDWKAYMNQVEGHKEGQAQGTNTVKYTLEQLELLKSKGLLKEEMVQSLLEKGLVEL